MRSLERGVRDNARRPWPCAAPQRHERTGRLVHPAPRFAVPCRRVPMGHRPFRRWDVSQPLLRFGAPSALSALRVRIPRVCLTRHLPPSGFRCPSTVCSSPHLAAIFRRQRSWGSRPVVSLAALESARVSAPRGRSPTNRCLSIHAGRDRQDTCPSLGHAGSHPVFETIKALDATRTPLTHGPDSRTTGSRAHPSADRQRPPPRRYGGATVRLG